MGTHAAGGTTRVATSVVRLTTSGVLLITFVAAACGPGDFEDLMSSDVCAPHEAFTADIDNPYLPLPAGRRIELRGDGLLVRITVLDQTEIVAGVETRIVEEYEATDGRVVEVSRNYFAQARDGTVCYFGEDVDMYDENGDVTSHAGAWRAGGGNAPGIFMPSPLRVGQAFHQEIAPGVAEDQANVVALGEATDVPAGTFDDTVTVLDRNPLDGTEDTKVYARDVGLIVDEAVRMTRFVPGG